MSGPSTDTIALVCAQLTQAYVAGNPGLVPFDAEAILNTYNTFIGMLEDQHAAPVGQFDMGKLVE